jgi:hypothetical protein
MKGSSEESYIKHEQIRRLALGQAAIALRTLLRNGGKVRIADMHAGDGIGVEPSQFRLAFMPQDSAATPLITYDVAKLLREHGVGVDHYLCEINSRTRKRLARLARNMGAKLISDHAELPDIVGYRWGLYINDPNGPGKHGDATLTRIARRERTSDFIIVVNESALSRIAGVKTPTPGFSWARTPEDIAAFQENHAWRSDPGEWAKRLHRSSVLASRSTYGSHAMKGRILLVSNCCQNTPPGYELLHPEQSAA